MDTEYLRTVSGYKRDLLGSKGHMLRDAADEIEALRSLCLDAAAALVGPSDTFEGCQDVIDEIHAHLGQNVNPTKEQSNGKR